jgi:putative nucleotidyltransferase with HDIG domain
MNTLPKNAVLRELLNALPAEGAVSVDWDALQATALGRFFTRMAETPQNPAYHGEGNVCNHTKRVCEALLSLDGYRSASVDSQRALFLAALFHDIGKIPCTRMENGVPTSPHHASTGARMAREFLWKECGLSGSPEARALRETVCLLVRYHSFPPYAIHEKNAERRLLRIASNSEAAPGFSVRGLCLLERADILGRICADPEESMDRVEYCGMLAEELGCADGAYSFADPHSRRAYFRGQTDWREQKMFDDTWGEVILLCGLPGTGKDTWIDRNCPDLPMVSLDNIRRRMGIDPTEPQGKVAAAAHEEARELLRRHVPFVWNATNITADMRSKQISLFEQYGASVRTVFLETDWEEGLRRNAARPAEVPFAVVERMLSKLEMPETHESTAVEWETT